METRAQRKQQKDATAIRINKKRELKVVLKRLSNEELQIHGVSNLYFLVVRYSQY